MQAAFGLYHIAEKKISEVLRKQKFEDLVKLSKYFFG